MTNAANLANVAAITNATATDLTVSGNVGIGTSSPAAKLDVSGGSIRVNEDGVGTKVITVRSNWAGVDPAINVTTNNSLLLMTNNTEQMRLNSSGNLGIGTTSQNERLRVNSSTAGQARLTVAYADTPISYFGSYSGIVGSGNATDVMLSSANVLAFGSGGTTERMRLDSSGKLGIGTTSPSIQLGLSAGGAASYGGMNFSKSSPYSYTDIYAIGESGTWQGTMRFFTSYNTTTPTEAMRIDSSGNLLVGITSGSYKFMVGDGTRDMCINPNSTLDGTFLGTIQSKPLIFGTGNTERARINTSGDFLVGMSSSSYTAAGRGVINVNGGSTAIYALNTGGSNSGYLYHDGSVMSLTNLANSALAFATNNTEKARIDSSGNLIVGGTTNYGKITSANGTFALVTNTSSQRRLSFWSTANGDSENAYIQVQNDGATTNTGEMLFATKNSGGTLAERARIDASGNLLVGLTTQIRSGDRASIQGTGAQVLTVRNNTNTSGYSTYSSIVQSSGNNTSTYHFWGNTDTVGNWYLYGNGTTSFSSDARLKKNIETTRDGYIEDLCKLRVVKYNWKKDDDSTPKELGLIAQEVEQVFPGLVQDDLNPVEKGGELYKQVKQSVLPFMLLKAIQEQQALITQLTARIAALEGK